MRAARNVRDVSQAQILCSIKRYHTVKCPHCGRKTRVAKNLIFEEDAKVHCNRCDQSYLLKDNIIGEE